MKTLLNVGCGFSNKSQIKGLQAIIDNPKNGYSPNMTTRDLWSRYNLDTRIAAMKGN